MRLHFDESSHSYRVDGRAVPSVTQVLRSVGASPQYRSDNPLPREIGTAVHLATQLDDEDDLDEEALDPVIAPYLEGWRAFRQESGFDPISIEYRVACMVYRYAGTLDRVGLVGHDPVLVDIKTGNPPASAALQMAAYGRCLPFHVKRWTVELKSSGAWKIHSHEDRHDAETFLAALAIYNWRDRNGLNRKG